MLEAAFLEALASDFLAVLEADLEADFAEILVSVFAEVLADTFLVDAVDSALDFLDLVVFLGFSDSTTSITSLAGVFFSDFFVALFELAFLVDEVDFLAVELAFLTVEVVFTVDNSSFSNSFCSFVFLGMIYPPMYSFSSIYTILKLK